MRTLIITIAILLTIFACDNSDGRSELSQVEHDDPEVSISEVERKLEVVQKIIKIQQKRVTKTEEYNFEIFEESIGSRDFGKHHMECLRYLDFVSLLKQLDTEDQELAKEARHVFDKDIEQMRIIYDASECEETN